MKQQLSVWSSPHRFFTGLESREALVTTHSNTVASTWGRHFHSYRSVPLIRPPILYTTSSLRWRRGLHSNMQLVLSISHPPPPQSFTWALCTLKFHVYIHVRTQLQKHSTQNSWYRIKSTCSWTSHLQNELETILKSTTFWYYNSRYVTKITKPISKVNSTQL